MDQTRRVVPALVAVVLIGLALTGCSRKAPIYNVSSAPVVVASGQLSAEQVRSAIIKAATDSDWIVKEDDPGRLLLQTFFRRHSATVAVDYSPTEYDITYYDSEALQHDGSNIHRNYNNLVVQLQREINLQLTEVSLLAK